MKTQRKNLLSSPASLTDNALLPPIEDEDALPIFAYRDVGVHNSEQSAFVSYDGFVYDITRFLRFHPGGRSILRPALGTDITDTLESFHQEYVSRLLRSDEYRRQHG